MLNLNEHLLYQPIPQLNNDKPLKDCVITIIGYEIIEKNTIDNLCCLLGACTQSLFTNKQTVDARPNSHLICENNTEVEYNKAKSWKLPVVGVDSLDECCKSGVKQDEAKFSIKTLDMHTDLNDSIEIGRNIEITSININAYSSLASKSINNENNSTFSLQKHIDNSPMQMKSPPKEINISNDKALELESFETDTDLKTFFHCATEKTKNELKKASEAA